MSNTRGVDNGDVDNERQSNRRCSNERRRYWWDCWASLPFLVLSAVLHPDSFSAVRSFSVCARSPSGFHRLLPGYALMTISAVFFLLIIILIIVIVILLQQQVCCARKNAIPTCNLYISGAIGIPSVWFVLRSLLQQKVDEAIAESLVHQPYVS